MSAGLGASNRKMLFCPMSNCPSIRSVCPFVAPQARDISHCVSKSINHDLDRKFMPDFDLFLVDWKKAAAYHKKEALETMLADAIPRSAKWIKQLPWVGKAPADYFDVADAWEAMKEEPEGVPEKMHAAACAFMDVTITYQDFHNDLGAENVLLAISPKAAARFSTLARKVDFS